MEERIARLERAVEELQWATGTISATNQTLEGCKTAIRRSSEAYSKCYIHPSLLALHLELYGVKTGMIMKTERDINHLIDALALLPRPHIPLRFSVIPSSADIPIGCWQHVADDEVKKQDLVALFAWLVYHYKTPLKDIKNAPQYALDFVKWKYPLLDQPEPEPRLSWRDRFGRWLRLNNYMPVKTD